MKRFTLVILLFITTINLYSQNQVVKIDIIVSEFYVDTLYCQIEFQCFNISDSSLVLWIEKDNIDSLSDYMRIKKHFYTTKGDFSLMEILLDGNIGRYVPELFTIFKIIKPQEQFTISILKKGSVEPEMIDSIQKHIVVVKASDIKRFYQNEAMKKFNYQSNHIIIWEDWIKSN